MGRFKKLFSIILTIALIASLVVPAQAATISHTEEALKLQNIKMFAGGYNDLNLDQGVTRIQGLTFAIRAAGNDKAVLAMSKSEVDSILASWVDADTYADWARMYAAYAIKNRITLGVSSTEKRLNPDELISGASFLVFILKSMGYADINTGNATESAVSSSVLSITQAAIYSAKHSLLRDDAAGILYGAFTKGVNKDGTKLIDTYINSGATTKQDAADSGFITLEPPKPTNLEAIKASATNLKEIIIEFNNELDPISAIDKDNYSVVDYTIDNIRLNSDKKSVNIMLNSSMNNQSEYKVTVKTGVKSSTGISLDESKQFTETAFDVTIPKALSAEQTGPTSFKVRFSEPVRTQNAVFKLDDGAYFISNIASADNGYSLDVTLYSTIPNGQHRVEVSAVEDYVPYRCVTTILNFVAAKDEVAPAIAKVISATPDKVELEFTKDVIFAEGELAAITGIYHTNSANRPTSVSLSGNKLTLTFTYNKLPNGTAYLSIAQGLFKDSWGNRNEAIKDMPITVKADKTKPTVKSVSADGDKSIVIEFSEDIQSGIGKFTLLDATGKDVTSNYAIGKVYDKSKVTLTFNEALAGKSFTVVIEDIKDSAGNVIDRVAPNVAVTDKTPPQISKGEIYKTKKLIKVTFNEPMNTNDIMNLANYQWGGLYLANTKVTISIGENGKAVMIDYSKESTISDTNHLLTVGRVRDAAGNAMANFANQVVLTDMELFGVTIASVEVTGPKTLVVTLSDSLVNFVPDDFLINSDPLKNYVAGVSYSQNKEGKGVLTFSLKEEHKITKTDLAGISIIVSTLSNPAEIKSANALGVKLAALNAMSAVDKIPATFEASFVDNSNIKLTFSEAVNPTTLSKFSFTVSGNIIKTVNIPSDGRTMTLTLDKEVNPNHKVTVSQVHEFEDLAGNASKGLSIDVTINKR